MFAVHPGPVAEQWNLALECDDCTIQHHDDASLFHLQILLFLLRSLTKSGVEKWLTERGLISVLCVHRKRYQIAISFGPVEPVSL